MTRFSGDGKPNKYVKGQDVTVFETHKGVTRSTWTGKVTGDVRIGMRSLGSVEYMVAGFHENGAARCRWVIEHEITAGPTAPRTP